MNIVDLRNVLDIIAAHDPRATVGFDDDWYYIYPTTPVALSDEETATLARYGFGPITYDDGSQGWTNA